MSSQAPVIIPVSKKKVMLLMGLVFLLAALILWLITGPVRTTEVFDYKGRLILSGILSALGILLVLFWAYLLKGMLKNVPGLVISEQGLHHQLGPVPAGLVPWPDIERIREIKAGASRYFVVDVRNPHAYIARQPQGFRQRAMEQQMEEHGSPVVINPAMLQCTFEELRALLHSACHTYKEPEEKEGQ